MQIRYDVARLPEGEMPVELQPVSGRWDAWMWCVHMRFIIPDGREKSRGSIS
jgi:hypothetical protein